MQLDNHIFPGQWSWHWSKHVKHFKAHTCVTNGGSRDYGALLSGHGPCLSASQHWHRVGSSQWSLLPLQQECTWEADEKQQSLPAVIIRAQKYTWQLQKAYTPPKPRLPRDINPNTTGRQFCMALHTPPQECFPWFSTWTMQHPDGKDDGSTGQQARSRAHASSSGASAARQEC